MERYCLYGMSLVSDLAFPQLVKETEEYRRQHPDDWQIEIVKGKIPQDIRERTDVKYEFGDDFSWLVNSTAWIIVENGKRITYELKEGGRVDYLRSYLLGWGMSMLALQRGILAIHCSAVADEAGAILICGESGAGKSTVTTERQISCAVYRKFLSLLSSGTWHVYAWHCFGKAGCISKNKRHGSISSCCQ